MKDCLPSVAPTMRSERFNLNQRPKNDLRSGQLKEISYASKVENLMYAQVCIRPDIAFIFEMSAKYQSNRGLPLESCKESHKISFNRRTTTCLCTNDQMT